MEIHTDGSRLFYHRQGQGSKNLLLFHGFGQDHHFFSAFANVLSDHYTCYIFDLYFHGQSLWANNEQPLKKQEWKKVITAFLQTEGLKNFSLLGFSMGGKFALAILESFPEHTTEMFLIAPDGIKTNGWFTLATYPLLLRRFFKSMIHHPNRFFSITQYLRKLRVLDAGLLRFAERQMNTEEKRKRVYYTWVVFRHLKFDLKVIARLLNEYTIPLTLVAGTQDKMIRPDHLQHFARLVQKCNFVLLEADHTNIVHAFASIVLNPLKSSNDSLR